MRTAALFFALVAGPAAAETTIAFTVAAGKHDRANTPVTIPLSLDAKVIPGAKVDVRDDKGGLVGPGQLSLPSLATRSIKAGEGKQRLDLAFVLPAVKAGASLDLKATIADSPPEKSKAYFMWHDVADKSQRATELRLEDRPVLRYVYTALDETTKESRAATFKVFHHVFDPRGERPITNGAGGRFPHHRGLFYGFMKTTYDKHTVDTWHCTNDTHQAHRAFQGVAAGPALGRHLVAVDWNGVGKTTFAVEQRELTAWNVPGGTLIDFVSVLTPTGPDVKLDGDPQHAGFHFRATNDVAEKTEKETVFIRPDGTDEPGVTRNWEPKTGKGPIDLPWLAMSFVVGKQRYTTAYLDRPDNPKPARFSERAYGRFGSYFVTTVTKDKPLTVRYRVWLQEGQMKPDEVVALSRDFAEPVAVTLK